jgi:hypothetical protein
MKRMSPKSQALVGKAAGPQGSDSCMSLQQMEKSQSQVPQSQTHAAPRMRAARACRNFMSTSAQDCASSGGRVGWVKVGKHGSSGAGRRQASHAPEAKCRG